jgi:hypothetical protein
MSTFWKAILDVWTGQKDPEFKKPFPFLYRVAEPAMTT